MGGREEEEGKGWVTDGTRIGEGMMRGKGMGEEMRRERRGGVETERKGNANNFKTVFDNYMLLIPACMYMMSK